MGGKGVFQNNTVKFILFLGILVLCWYLGRIFKLDAETLREYFAGFPVVLSGLIFVAIYVATTTFIWLGPKDVLRISSAIFFGGPVSAVYVTIGELVNAFVMFHLSRSLGREYVVEKFKGKAREIDQMGRDHSALGMMAWRINPLIPFRLMDLGYGLTNTPFHKYITMIAAITFVRVLWLQMILAGIGTAILSDMSAIYDYMSGNLQVIQISAVYFLAVLITTIAALVHKRMRKKA